MSLWRPVLIAIMAACLVIALLAFIRRFVPDLPAIFTQLLIALGHRHRADWLLDNNLAGAAEPTQPAKLWLQDG